jgi:hypothetical protein
MAIDSAPAFFESLAACAHQPRLADAAGTWEFDIEGVGTWTVAVDHGVLSVSDGASSGPAEGVEEATTRLRLREDELLRLVRGDGHENLFMGVIRGAIVVEGGLAFAQRLQALFPRPDEWSART